MLAEQVISVIAETKKLPASEVSLDSSFEQLGIDSLDSYSILFALEETFNISIPDEVARNIKTVRQAVEALEGLVSKQPAPSNNATGV
ncbi:MAG: acyl carrier protein [Acidobacteriota bacterium]